MKTYFGMPDLEQIATKNSLTIHELQIIINRAMRSMTTVSKTILVKEDTQTQNYLVQRNGFGSINSPFGKFYEYDFLINDRWQKYSVIVKGKIDENGWPHFIDSQNSSLIVRTDSGCETGQVFGDQTCDCEAQLHRTMEIINNIGEGIIINIPKQDGRGLGLPFKLATLQLQDELSIDTVAAALLLARDYEIDIRTYAGVIAILKFFDIPVTQPISLATNNIKKINVFVENGYSIAERIPVVIKPTKLTLPHLEAKQKYLGHLGLLGKESDKNDY